MGIAMCLMREIFSTALRNLDDYVLRSEREHFINVHPIG